MTANHLAQAISARVEALWEKLPDKEAPLTVAQVRELELDVHKILVQAKIEVCTHRSVYNGQCFDCGKVLTAKAGG